MNSILHVKVLLSRFLLNGNIIGICPRTQKLYLHTRKIVPCETAAGEVSFEFHPQTQMLELPTNLIAPCLCMEILKFIPVTRLNRLNQLVLRHEQR